MIDQVRWVPDKVWADIVTHAPVPSVDLIIEYTNGVLLARRNNEPAKGEWFVPGGRVQKGEPIREAVHRIAREELDIEVKIKREIGTYDHFYQTAEVADAGGKHYIAHGYHVIPETEMIRLNEQHKDSEIFQTNQLPELHPYVREYLIRANIIEK